jgi:two-component system C4-dicarboxylate transport response regulator DctD
MASWQAADWPGNVRELRNFAERLTLGLVPAAPPSARPDDLPLAAASAPAAAAPADAASPDALPHLVDAFERDLILRALAAADNNISLAADRLLVPRKTLYDKLKKFQIASKPKS